MAKATLPTNFVDDIMTDAMGNKRRYNLIQNSDGTVSLEDVTDYTQIGSTFGAAQVNETNEAVNESVDKAVVINYLDDVIANTQLGKVAGASALKGLNSKLEGQVASYTDKLTLANSSFFEIMSSRLKYNKITGHTHIEVTGKTLQEITAGKIFIAAYIHPMFSPENIVSCSITPALSSGGNAVCNAYPSSNADYPRLIRACSTKTIGSGYYIYISADYYIEPNVV